MPLKPMFSRAPLTRQPLAPLAPEHIRLEGSAAETLERLCALAASTSMNAELAEGALTCAYLQHNEELAANTEKWLWTQLAEQREDGGLPGDTETNLRLMLAAARLYQICTKQFGGMSGDLSGYFLSLAELFMLAAINLGGI